MSRVTPTEIDSSRAGMSARIEPSTAALRLAGVSKSFPGVRALSDVDLVVRAGTLHALVGENGSGKSTLVKVACGVLRSDSGRVTIGGAELSRPSALAARRLGLYAAYQDTALVAEMTVLENVMLSFTGRRRYAGPLRRQQARKLLEAYRLNISLDAPLAHVNPGMRQLLEVVRALIHEPDVLLLDEPTAALDADRIARLEELVHTAKESGTAILYISHRLEEVERLADEVTVLRDGEVQANFPRGDWSVPTLVSLMVGAPIDLTFPDKAEGLDGAAPVLQVRQLRGDGFGPVDVHVRSGEIAGIAGAEGNGQRELVRALIGLHSAEGTIEIDGQRRRIRSPGDAIRAGIRFLSGDRAAESIFVDMSVMANSTVSMLNKLGPAGLVRRIRERKAYAEAAQALGIVSASPDQPIGGLSGGNQQKSVMARALLDPARLLVIDEPTQGVDAKSRIDIYHALREQAARGCGVLINSSDSLELAGLCDRVYVVSRGVVTQELQGEQMTESTIVHGFVSTAGREVRHVREAHPRLRSVASVVAAPSFPLAAITVLILLVGGYTALKTSVFLGSANLNSLLQQSLPLIVVAIGQQIALLARGFDISVGAMMSLTVVFASFHITSASLISILPGVLLVLALGAAVGFVNGFVVRVLNVNAIIATIGMLGVLSGIALIRRPQPGGVISSQLFDVLSVKQVAFIPVSFIVLVVLAVAAQIALLNTGAGLSLRATGFDEEAGRRLGVRVAPIKIGAFVLCSVIAAIAGLFLAGQTGVGAPDVGDSYALLSIAACVIGGASLGGGRGSFVGCVIAAVFLTLLVNIAPLLQLSSSYSGLVTGSLTLVAILAYTLNRRLVR